MRERRAVVQSVSAWLAITETWLANQIHHLPGWVDSHVTCADRIDAGAFPLPEGRLHAAEDRPARRALDRALRHVGPRPLGPVGPVARRTGARVVHSHFGHVGWFDHRVAARAGVRHVVSFYGLDVRRLPREDPRWEARYRELFDEVALVLCEGPAMADAIAALGCDRARIRIHRLGVDLGRLPPFRSRTAAPGRLRVLMAGSFREKKGFPDALEALGQLVRDGLDVSGTLIGDAGPRDTAERDRILASLRRAGLEDRIRLTGFQPHTRLLAEADAHDVFLSPSVTAADGDCEGGAPVSIIEMAAIGLPVLSTTHCDIPTVLGEPNRALLVPERDPEALARACHALLERDWDVIARANRELVETELDARQQGERLAHAYFPGDPH